jgi:anaerobic ribonucleoside-triphosphate reductase activating protein
VRLEVAEFHYPALSYEGVGMAMVIYFKGCRNRCIGCHNEELQSFGGGKIYISIMDIVNAIEKIEHIKNIDSFVFSGGEPLHQHQQSVFHLAKFLKMQFHKPLWLYTSYLFNEIPSNPDFRSVFDVIIDGPFVQDQHVEGLKYRGSKNQNVWIKMDSTWGIWDLEYNRVNVPISARDLRETFRKMKGGEYDHIFAQVDMAEAHDAYSEMIIDRIYRRDEI